MAIDTREKRQAVVAISLYPIGPNVTNNASPDQEWRQESGYGYPGILAAAPGGGPTIPVLLANYRQRHSLSLG